MFLLLTVAYLLALLGQQRSPFSDREFLIIFNALLLVVWGITVFSVTGRADKSSRLLDLTNLSLVFVTLVIDAIALTAILYRLFQFGITPNRIAVTGANLLIFVHLVWIFFEYLKAFQRKSGTEVIKTTIGRYLPVYSLWSIFVFTGLPLSVWFQLSAEQASLQSFPGQIAYSLIKASALFGFKWNHQLFLHRVIAHGGGTRNTGGNHLGFLPGADSRHTAKAHTAHILGAIFCDDYSIIAALGSIFSFDDIAIRVIGNHRIVVDIYHHNIAIVIHGNAVGNT